MSTTPDSKHEQRNTMSSDTEFLDVVNEQGMSTGIFKLRTEVHRDGDWHKTVHVWLINKNRELLLQLRADNKESFPGYWDISCAGHQGAGETALQAAQREGREELGILPAPERLEYLFSISTRAVLNKSTFFDNEISDVYLAHSDASVKDFHVPNAEVAQVRWFSIAEIKSCIQSNSLPVVPHHEEYGQLFSHLNRRYACIPIKKIQ